MSLSLLFVFFPLSSRAKRSPKQRRRHQINGRPIDAEKDRLITTDSDGTYKRPPGVNNSAYIVCMSVNGRNVLTIIMTAVTLGGFWPSDYGLYG